MAVTKKKGSTRLHELPAGSRGLLPHVNRGIGKGNAMATELATKDARAATALCGVAGCGALCDIWWIAQHARQAGRSEVHPADGCGRCSAAGKKHHKVVQWARGQINMASALRRGETPAPAPMPGERREQRRRLVVRPTRVDMSWSRDTWDLPAEDAVAAADAAEHRARGYARRDAGSAGAPSKSWRQTNEQSVGDASETYMVTSRADRALKRAGAPPRRKENEILFTGESPPQSIARLPMCTQHMNNLTAMHVCARLHSRRPRLSSLRRRRETRPPSPSRQWPCSISC